MADLVFIGRFHFGIFQSDVAQAVTVVRSPSGLSSAILNGFDTQDYPTPCQGRDQAGIPPLSLWFPCGSVRP
ncbi:hypothetical protein PE067_18295 [Paracoccus sp. DMF-8]|uniref:hypothetical protein n=1 Tax=Paracoccus sp. DMF-8 TaxID=3019445 RepID=UPI0023E365FC|nr:hypothetical protein [Paracoccus sp. DMF-8]MDF3607917.1 hypothetical protein [Paracoccus sp. DMF-8]